MTVHCFNYKLRNKTVCGEKIILHDRLDRLTPFMLAYSHDPIAAGI